jgi:hypothetical protein
MKNITLILFVLLAFSSCKKRDVFYEDKMWDKLSKGNGIWLLEKREVFVIKSDGSTELTFIEEPDQTKYYFYTKIIQLFGISVENDYLDITKYNSNTDVHSLSNTYFLSRLAGGAENERITLENPAGGSVDKIYTVEKGGSKNQIWTLHSGGGSKEVITLKKCNSCSPDLLGSNPTEVTG